MRAPLPLRPAPSPLVDTLLFTVLSSHRRHWDQEVKRAQKDAREPSLTKAIVKCYWKPYVVWGMFTFLEVKDFYTVHCFLLHVCGQHTYMCPVLRWTGQVGREASSLRSKDKPSRKHDRAQKLYLSLQWVRTELQGLAIFL